MLTYAVLEHVEPQVCLRREAGDAPLLQRPRDRVLSPNLDWRTVETPTRGHRHQTERGPLSGPALLTEPAKS